MNYILNIEYDVKYSKRKTISICINKDLKVIIRAPIYMKGWQAEAFIIKHQSWIEKNLEKMKKRIEDKKSFSFSDGDIIFYFGKKYILSSDNNVKTVEIKDNYLIISNKISNRQKEIKDFFKQKANEYILKKVICFSNIMNVKASSVKITSAKTRWGSCSGKNNICFSYRVMCLPPDIIDYIVVHELAHIKQHNHSNMFYNEILKVMPDYKKRLKELKKIQKEIMI